MCYTRSFSTYTSIVRFLAKFQRKYRAIAIERLFYSRYPTVRKSMIFNVGEDGYGNKYLQTLINESVTAKLVRKRNTRREKTEKIHSCIIPTILYTSFYAIQLPLSWNYILFTTNLLKLWPCNLHMF